MYGKIEGFNRITGLTPDYRYNKKKEQRFKKSKRSFDDILNDEKNKPEDGQVEQHHVNIRY